MKTLLSLAVLFLSTQVFANTTAVVDLTGQWKGTGTVLQNTQVTNCPNVNYKFSQTKVSLFFATNYECEDDINFEMEGEVEIRGKQLVIEDVVVGELQADRAIIDHVQDGQSLYFEAILKENHLSIKASMADTDIFLGITGELDPYQP